VAENSLVWNFIAKDKGASKTIDRLSDRVSKMGIAFGTALGSLAASGIRRFGGALADGLRDAVQYQTLGLKTAAVIKSTGNAAHLSVAGIKAQAAALEDLSGVDENLIINSENVLAGFTKVRNEAGRGNDVFNQATKAALNMSVALGTDMQGATIKIGKALQDPVKGLAALSKAGVSFTDSQKKQIEQMVKSGNAMGAQKIILKQLETRFGGAAKAAGTGFAGAWARVKDSVADASRDMVLKALPALTKIGNMLADKLPGWIETGRLAVRAFFLAFKDGDVTSDGLVGAFERVGAFMHNYLIPAFNDAVKIGKNLFDFYKNNQTTLQALAVGILAVATTIKVVSLATKAWAAVQAAFNVIMALNPIGIVILAVIGLAAALIYAWKRSEKFRDVVNGAFTKVKDIAVGAFNKVKGAAETVWNWLKKNWPLLLAIITGPIGIATLFVIRHWDAIKKGAGDAINGVTTWFKSLPGKVTSAVGNLRTLLLTQGKQLLDGLKDGALSKVNDIKSWVSSIGQKIVDGVKGFFGIHSPSTVFAGLGGNMIEGLMQGLASKSPQEIATKALGSLPNALSAMLQKGLVSIGDLPGKALSALGNVTGKAKEWLSGLFGGSGGGNSSNQALGQIMAASYGWTGGQWEALKALWNNESGWNNNAQNPTSTAYGIAQFLNSTWSAFGAQKTSDPAGQIAAGLRYIASVYGSPMSALGAWQSRSPHWYDEGGMLMPGYNWTYNGTRKPERVLTEDQWNALSAGGDVFVTVKIGEQELTAIVDTRVERGIDNGVRKALGKRGSR